MTEPPALMTVPDEGDSGLWLWHGAPTDQQNAAPGEQKLQRVSRRGAHWLGIGAAFIVAALSALGAFVSIMPRLREPAAPAASSPATVAIVTPIPSLPTVNTPSSPPPMVDTPASLPATIDTRAATTAVAGPAASAPASPPAPAGVLAEPPPHDRAVEPAPSRPSAAARRRVSSQGSRRVVVKPEVIWHHNSQRFSKKTGTSLADQLASPAFQNGTLRPVPDH